MPVSTDQDDAPLPAVRSNATSAGLAPSHRAAYRLVPVLDGLHTEGHLSHAALARALNAQGVPTPKGRGASTHTTVARVAARAPAD